MKKTTLIIIGIVAVVILFALWLYLLVYGTPTKVTEYFTDFSLFGSKAAPIVVPTTPTPVDTTPVTVNVKKGLRQLTTRPTIGAADFKETGSTSTTTLMRYAEAGTGHIYQINLSSGEEVRISNVTVPNAELAAFSPDGNYVAIRSGFGNKNDIILVTLHGSADATAETLSPAMTEFTWNTQNELEYTRVTSDGMSGEAMNPITKQSRILFTVPFQTGTMIWSHSSGTPNYIYPRAASRLLGYLYAIKNGTIARLPLSGPGFVADANSRYIVGSFLNGTTPISYIYNVATGETNPAPFITDPNKCAFSPAVPNQVFCGNEIGVQYSENFPDDWYQGTRSFSDNLWMINLDRQTAIQLANPLSETGREIDMTNMSVSRNSTMIYFTNKNDNTLWLYEI